MKKTLLTLGAAIIALTSFSQNPGLSTTAAYDDFKDADGSTLAIDEYSYPTTLTKWDNIVKAPVTGEFAYRGVIWTQGTKAVEGVNATKSRTGNGVLGYTISQDTGKYVPFLALFGSYAEGTVKKDFTVDLSNDATVSFSFKNAGTKTVRLSLQLQDANDSTLMYDKGVLEVGEFTYNHNIGFVQGKTAAVLPGATVNFTYDWKNAVIGRKGDQAVVPGNLFDYSKVKAILFTLVNDAVVSLTAPADYRPVALVDYPIEFTNFQLGDVSTIVAGLSNDFIIETKNEVLSVYNSEGIYITKGKASELNLEAGKLYILKSATKSRKVIISK